MDELDRRRGAGARELRGALARTAAEAALQLAWRGLAPGAVGPFAERPAGLAIRRLYYTADDGWQAPLFRVAPADGPWGPPVVLAHGLGLNRHALDWSTGSLTQALADAGFDVFLLEHRGDRTGLAPPGARPWDFDDLAARDVPAAVDLVRDVTGARRVLWVGHGLGGQLGLAHVGLTRGDDVAALVTLAAPVRFPVAPSHARAAAWASVLLPAGASLPLRASAMLAAPAVGGAEGGVRRGVLLHGAEDIGGGLARQVLRWFGTGQFVDRHGRLDYLECSRGVRTPALSVCAAADPLCGPAAAAILEVLGGPGEELVLEGDVGHLDLLLHPAVAGRVVPKVVEFLGRWSGPCEPGAVAVDERTPGD